MIIDHIRNAALYEGLSDRIGEALRFLRETDGSGLSAGRIDVRGDDLFVLVQDYETKDPGKGLWEAHRKYIDIQFLAAGSERIGWAPLGALRATPYDASRDFTGAEGEGDKLRLTAGMFAILFPEDAHMPGLADGAPGPVRKLVVKIRL